jgi:SAM-dependent methyltransferase
LSVESVDQRERRLNLVLCPDCGCAFYDDLTPARYQDDRGRGGCLKFYVEQGAGIDVMLAPLFRFPPDRLRNYLEVGCGFGFSLDFARFAFGSHVCGIDPSALAKWGSEVLKLDIIPAYLGADTDFHGTRFNLILGSEVIEHVPNPHQFLTLIQRILAEEGALALTTPNAAAICPSTPNGILTPILSPGHHLILFSKASLEHALRASGFTHVHVWEYPHTLHAVASHSAPVFRQSTAVDRRLYRRYLLDRWLSMPAEMPVAHGLAYRLFKEHVNAGDHAAASTVFDRLRDAYADAYAIDLSDSGSITFPVDAEEAPDFEDFARSHPFNLTGVLYFKGVLEMNDRKDYDRALQYFQCAAKVGVAIRRALSWLGTDDGETENLVALARIHSVGCLSRVDPVCALAELEALGADLCVGKEPDGGSLAAATMLSPVRAELFVRLVNAGRYPEAAQLEQDVRAALRVAGEWPGTTAALGGDDDAALSSLFCLGILALNHHARFETAAGLFGLVHRLAVVACATQPQVIAATSLIWQARYHEALALKQTGNQGACEAIVRGVLEQRAAHLPEITEEVLAAVRGLAAN